jgi:hypothetical protein
VAGVPVGTVTINFFSANNATFNYTVNNVSGILNLTPVTLSGNSGAVANSNVWWDPDQSGQGITTQQEGNLLSGVWYLYDENGTGIWVKFVGELTNSTFTSDLFQFTGPAPGTTPWDNDLVASSSIGTVTVNFSASDAASFDYIINNVTGGLDLQPFHITLQPSDPSPTAESPSGFPNASTTGVTDAFCPDWESRKTRTSGRTITTPGATIEYQEIDGDLRIEASNVTVRCVKLSTTDSYGLECRSGCENLLVEDTEISGASEAQLVGLVSPAVYRRIHLHDSPADHLKLDAGTLEFSYLQNDFQPTPDSHNDAIQTGESSGPIVIRNNNIEGPFRNQTSAILMKSDFGPISNVTVESNRLYGGNFTLYLVDGGVGVPDNVIVRNNVFVRDSWNFGPTSIDYNGQCYRWENNTYDDGAPVDGPSGGC